VRGRNYTWSPDGAYIAYSATREGIYDIYIVNAEGSDKKRLTPNFRPTNAPFQMK